MNRVVSVVIYLIVGLAVIGVATQLVTNTASFFTSLFVMIGIGVAIAAALYFIFIRKRNSSNDMKKYKQAVKQSKMKYNNSSTTSTTNKNQTKKSKKPLNKRASHLRVIEGNKSKKKTSI